MKKLFFLIMASVSFSAIAFDTVSLSEKMGELQLTATKLIVEGRLWAEATKECMKQGKKFAVQADKGFTYEVLQIPVEMQIPNSPTLRLGGFARFDCK